MNTPLKVFATILLAFGSSLFAANERPNVVLLFAEDTSPWMGTYGHEANKLASPNIDSIATDQDIKSHQIGGKVTENFVVHRAETLGGAFESIVHVVNNFGQCEIVD